MHRAPPHSAAALAAAATASCLSNLPPPPPSPACLRVCLQARTNPVPGTLPDAFTAVGGLGYASKPPSEWNQQMETAIKDFKVGGCRIACVLACLLAAESCCCLLAGQLLGDAGVGRKPPLVSHRVPPAIARLAHCCSYCARYDALPPPTPPLYAQASGDAIRNQTDRTILGHQQLEVGQAGRSAAALQRNLPLRPQRRRPFA